MFQDEVKIEEAKSSEHGGHDIENALKFDNLDHTADHKNGDCAGNGSSEITLDDKPKILIQRFFHQVEKNVVSQKLDYVIADTQEEITKHVYGGLFRKKYYSYAPHRYCQNHSPDLLEHNDETLVKLGDKFDSIESFRLYVDSHAKQWKYYLKCYKSHRNNGKAIFDFSCTSRKSKKKYFQSKGLRKRIPRESLCDCPCRVVLKAVPFGADNLTVIYVCNHHAHPLTDEHFQTLQHGRRLHPSIKAELMDLLSLDVDKIIIKKYLESLTGYNMKAAFFNNLYYSMKRNNVERNFSVEKLREMSKKIEGIKQELGILDYEENVDNDFIPEQSSNKDKASQVAEVFNVLKTVSATKKNRKPKQQKNAEFGQTLARRRNKKRSKEVPALCSTQGINKKSRLETRLQELKHDHETLQNIKHLQDSVRCEAERNPWVLGQEGVVPIERAPSGNKSRRTRKQAETNLPNEETQQIGVENIENNEEYVNNEDIYYENEMNVIETNELDCADGNEVTVNNNQELDDANTESYWLQYEDGNQSADKQEDHYVLLLDDVENFENLPEVQIQATELATVSIVSGNNQDASASEHSTANHSSFKVTSGNKEDDLNDSEPGQRELSLISVMEENMYDDAHECPEGTPQFEEPMVYEVIQSNDSKILPSREVVRTIIFNKSPTKQKLCKQSIKSKSEEKTCTLKSENKTRSNERLNKKMRNNVDKTSAILQFFKEEMGRNTFFCPEQSLKNSPLCDIELEDDDFYMVIVKNEEDLHSCDEADTNAELEDIDEKFFECEGDLNLAISSRSTNQEIGASSRETTHYKHKGSQCNIESEPDVIRYKNDIARLQQQKHFLEKDIENLLATKDNLIDDLTRSRRFKRGKV